MKLNWSGLIIESKLRRTIKAVIRKFLGQLIRDSLAGPFITWDFIKKLITVRVDIVSDKQLNIEDKTRSRTFYLVQISGSHAGDNQDLSLQNLVKVELICESGQDGY